MLVVGPVTSDHGIEQIRSRLTGIDARSPLIVAVDGYSAAGKSTFALRLADALDAAMVPGDDFYRVMDPAERVRLEPWEGPDRYYAWERMRDEALDPLRHGRSATYRPYDGGRNALEPRTKTIAPRPVVIVEGLFVPRPEFDSVNALTVVVVADSEMRRRRQLDRADAPHEWLQRWDAAERWYFEHVRPADRFDLIVHDTPKA
jgi:uridine kinase